MVAEVLIEYTAKKLDKTFDYLVPFNLLEKLKVGHKVKVEFASKQVEGFVLKIKNEINSEIKYKNILEIVNSDFILNSELLDLGKYMSKITYSSLISCYQIMLPKALKAKNSYNLNKKFINYIKLKNMIDLEEYKKNNKRNIAEIKILEDLIKTEYMKKSLYSAASVKNLEKKGLIETVKIEKNRLDLSEKNILKKEVVLNSEQEKVYNEIINTNLYQTFLLYGVTGSGKTEVYIKVIEKIINDGKSAIMLVPEISLTPQIVDRFLSVFGSNVAILHSRLSEGEKYDEYRRILNNEAKIVIGARSAIFAPVSNLGVIIVDEEHTNSYKQESTPKYNAIDIAKYRCEKNNALCILASATPMLETYARAKKNVYKYLELKNRANNKKPPKTILVDMTEEIKKRNFLISEILDEKIKTRLNNKEQIILLLNRRGYSTFINCSSCGYVYKCINCDISLTYHKYNNYLKCHYCGYQIKPSNICPKCHEKALTNLGMGTEKLEKIIQERYKVRTLRMDVDTTSKKGSHEKIINRFLNQEAEILIGTQMVSKGLNFPNVTLVGIITSDASLNLPDFRSSERTFQLLMQTAGRSGRSEKTGEVVIQTYNPNNYVLKAIQNNSYENFFSCEMQIRKELKYPPYYYLTSLKIVGTDFEQVKQESNKIKKYLNNNLTQDYIILGPTTASVYKINNKYRFSIIIKYKNEKLLNEILKQLNNNYINNKVNIEIDRNPMGMI